MNLAVCARTATTNLVRIGLRSALAALGIVIAVAAVIVVVSVGKGAQSSVEQTLANMELNQLDISGEPRPGHRILGRRWGLPPGDGLTIADYHAIRQQVGGIAASTVQVYGNVPGYGRTDLSHVNARGIDVQGFAVLRRVLVKGSLFGYSDVETYASVCVIPEFVAHLKFGDRSPIGGWLRIGDTPFTVIGVMEDDPNYDERGPNEPGDMTAYVPYTSFLHRIDREARVLIVLRAIDPAQLGRIQIEVSDLLERRRGTRVAEFVSGNVAKVVERQVEARRTLTVLLASIGLISLVVGGIGIMNVMIVSVTERTQEIGIRLALGTRARDVMLQFLAEATLLSVCAGLVGISTGIGIAELIVRLGGWPVRITPGTILFAFGCSATVGICSGLYPARTAAMLDPIQALRAA